MKTYKPPASGPNPEAVLIANRPSLVTTSRCWNWGGLYLLPAGFLDFLNFLL